MSLNGKAYIAGAFEHPTRKAVDKSLPQLHADVAHGALEDAGLSLSDVDGYFCAGDAPGLGPINMVDYLGIKPRSSTRPIPAGPPMSFMSSTRCRRSRRGAARSR